jgi:hypothetical protein
VQTGPAIRFDIERAGLVALAAAAGLGDVAVPEVETLTLEVDVPTTVVQELRTGDGGDLVMLQMPSPQATWPEGIDPVAFAEVGLLLLGMSDEDASRLAETIDWTSTVVVPLPTDIGTSSEVTVDGVTGLLLESSGMEPGSEEERMLLWERDGMVYAVVGKWVGARQLLLAADSLQ